MEKYYPFLPSLLWDRSGKVNASMPGLNVPFISQNSLCHIIINQKIHPAWNPVIPPCSVLSNDHIAAIPAAVKA
jgi:hypothetical protein